MGGSEMRRRQDVRADFRSDSASEADSSSDAGKPIDTRSGSVVVGATTTGQCSGAGASEAAISSTASCGSALSSIEQ